MKKGRILALIMTVLMAFTTLPQMAAQTIYADDGEYQTLMLDKEYSNYDDECMGVYYEFTPSETGYYKIYSYGNTDYSDPYVELYIYNETEDGYSQMDQNQNIGGEPYDYNFRLTEELDKGAKYRYKVYSNCTFKIEKVESYNLTFYVNHDGAFLYNSESEKYDLSSVSFSYGEGAIVYPQGIFDPKDIKYPDDSKIFYGWSTDPDSTERVYQIEITDNTSLYAIWTNKCTVTYHTLNDKVYFGTVFNEETGQNDKVYDYKETYASGEILYGTNNSPWNQEDETKLFWGWALEGEAEPIGAYTVTEDVDLYALYHDGITVKYDGNGGSVYGSDTYDYLTYAGAFFYECYPYSNDDQSKKFIGWYDAKEGGKRILSYDKVTSGMTVYAHWIEDDGQSHELNVIAKAYKGSEEINWNASNVTVKVKSETEAFTLEAAVSSDDSSGLGYKWYKANEGIWEQGRGTLIEGSESTLHVPSASDRCQYLCYVYDQYGNSQYVYFDIAIDNGFKLETVGETAKKVPIGGTVIMEVNAIGENVDGVKYQWSIHDPQTCDDIEIEGATGSSYILENVDNAEGIVCRATDKYGNCAEIRFYIYIDNEFSAFPKIGDDVQEGSSIFAAFPYNSSLKLETEVSAKDKSKITYQWRLISKKGEDIDPIIENGTNPTCSIASLDGNVQYLCEVDDGYGNTEYCFYYISVENHLTVKAVGETEILTAPGKDFTFEAEVTADDKNGLEYEWRDQNYNLLSSEATCSINNVQEHTTVRCSVTDKYGNYADVTYNVYVGFKADIDIPHEGYDWWVYDVEKSYYIGVSEGEQKQLKVKVETLDGVNVNYKWGKVTCDIYWAELGTDYIEGANSNSYIAEAVEPGYGVMEHYVCEVSDSDNKNTQKIYFSLQVDESDDTTIPVTGVALDQTTATLEMGETLDLTATIAPSNATNKNVTWSSSDEKVATVDETGKVTAVGSGTATITVTTEDQGKSATCTVKVNAKTIPVTGISLNKTSLSMTAGESQGLTATVSPSNATNKNVTWSSSNTSVATVSNGIVKAVAAGSATITVTTADGSKKAACSVTVKVKQSTSSGSSSGSGNSSGQSASSTSAASGNGKVFPDVSDPSKSYYKPVYWAVREGITVGYRNGNFGPADSCTRAQFVTFIWRMAGKPQPKATSSKFSDVNRSMSSFKPIMWAVEQGIIVGYSDGTFRPNANVTRRQVAVMLWRWQGKPSATKAAPFTDLPRSDSGYKAIQWGAEAGVIKGSRQGGSQVFKPNDNCQRQQIVTFLYRFARDVLHENVN